MDKNEIRAVIKYLFLKKLTQKEIHDDLVETLKEDAPSYSCVRDWCTDLRRGRRNTDDLPRSGRPQEIFNPKTGDKVLKMVMECHRVTVRLVAERFDISIGSVHYILHDVLAMNKVSC